MNNLTQITLPFGALLGYGPGNVPAYSSDYETVDEAEYPNRHSFRHYVDGVYTGFKWQCVEYARRWLLMNKGYVFDDVAMAYDIFTLTRARHIADNTYLPLKSFENGALRHPEPGCLLIWQEGGEFADTGHVAVVTEVTADYIRVVEQNVSFKAWPQDQEYSRQLNTRLDDDNGYWIECSFQDGEILGWVIQTDDSLHSYDPPPEDLAKRLLTIAEALPPKVKKNWLNIANADEQAYVKANGHLLVQAPQDQDKCLLITSEAITDLRRITNELHALFLHATDYVAHHPEVHHYFNFPAEIWPGLQKSWANRRHQMITGRFDFAMTEQGIKVYEYNCDSASCHMETGKIQGLWAKYHRFTKGEDAGEDLFDDLVEAWKDSGATLVHLLADNSPEERYHSEFMQLAIHTAGVKCKKIDILTSLTKKDGIIYDDEQQPVRWIWKTWAWETALDQLRDTGELAPETTNDLHLKDILFNASTLCFEPLWTLIPSNKAILPILWQLFPNHPHLLNSAFECTEALQQAGFVKKPIVGRCGANIEIVQHQTTLEATAGQFQQQESIYQELFALPNIDGKYVQLCTFTVGGKYSAACTRIDPSLIVTSDSDIMPLRIV